LRLRRAARKLEGLLASEVDYDVSLLQL